MSLSVAIILMSDLFGDLSADDADVDHDAAIRVVMGIKNKGAQDDRRSALSGQGTVMKMLSRISLMPMPVFAEQQMALEASRPITSSICFLTPSTSAAGKIDFVDDRDDF